MIFRFIKCIISVISPLTALVLFTIPDTSNGQSDEEVKLHMVVQSPGGDKTIEYKYSMYHWEDIPKLLENETGPVTDICSRGTWIFYEKPLLLNTDPTDIAGLSAFTSEEEVCYQKEELGHDLGSVQHVTAYHRRTTDTITFFEYENFLGRAMIVNKARKLPHEEPGYYTYPKSLITIGTQQWTVVLEGPVRLCFSPPSIMHRPVCFISTLIDGEILIDSGVLQVNHADEGCQRNNSYVIPMTECYESSYGVIHPKPTSPGDNATVPCNITNEVLDGDLIGLVAARLNGSLGSGEWFHAIKDPKQIWKTELFDKSFQVFTKICPDLVIEREYLLIFASLYFYHMGKIWESGKFLDAPISEIAWMEILHDMNSCLSIVMAGDYEGIAEETANEMKSYTSLEDVTGKLEDMLGYRPQNDHVMEINWLMANLVAGICTRAKQYDTNFLPRFLNIYHVLYFSPVEEQWAMPGKFETIYKYLFGGYGMYKSLTKIALCTFNAMQFSGITESYKRPMEQTDKILLPNPDVNDAGR